MELSLVLCGALEGWVLGMVVRVGGWGRNRTKPAEGEREDGCELGSFEMPMTCQGGLQEEMLERWLLSWRLRREQGKDIKR